MPQMQAFRNCSVLTWRLGRHYAVLRPSIASSKRSTFSRLWTWPASQIVSAHDFSDKTCSLRFARLLLVAVMQLREIYFQELAIATFQQLALNADRLCDEFAQRVSLKRP